MRVFYIKFSNSYFLATLPKDYFLTAVLFILEIHGNTYLIMSSAMYKYYRKMYVPTYLNVFSFRGWV